MTIDLPTFVSLSLCLAFVVLYSKSVIELVQRKELDSVAAELSQFVAEMSCSENLPRTLLSIEKNFSSLLRVKIVSISDKTVITSSGSRSPTGDERALIDEVISNYEKNVFVTRRNGFYQGRFVPVSVHAHKCSFKNNYIALVQTYG